MKENPHQNLPGRPMLMLRLIVIIALSYGLIEVAEEFYHKVVTPSESVYFEVFEILALLGLLLAAMNRYVIDPMLREVTLRRGSEQTLQQLEQRARIVMDSIPDNILHVTTEGVVIDFKPAKKSIFSFVAGRNVSESLPAELLADFYRCMNSALKEDTLQRMDFAFKTDDKPSYHVFNFVRATDTELLIFIRDITERKIYEEKLEHVSTHDVLTGLYNRAYYEAELDRLLTGRRYPVSIIIIDLDGLKATNDTYGHAAGDRMICKAADVLKKSFRAEDLVARTGGDEFTVLLPDTGAESTDASIERIQQCLEEANSLNDGYDVKMSMGYAIAESKEKLLGAVKIADLRMYENKSFRKTSAAIKSIIASNEVPA